MCGCGRANLPFNSRTRYHEVLQHARCQGLDDDSSPRVRRRRRNESSNGHERPVTRWQACRNPRSRRQQGGTKVGGGGLGRNVGGERDLAEKSLATQRGSELRLEDLPGDGPVVPDVVGSIHRGHPAATALPLDFGSGRPGLPSGAQARWPCYLGVIGRLRYSGPRAHRPPLYRPVTVMRHNST